MKCFHCKAEVTNGLALCEMCQYKVTTDLEFLPVYFRNLARWRPGRAGSRPVPGSRVLYDGFVRGAGTGDRISDTLDETCNELTTWARALVDDRPYLARLFDRLAAARAAETVTEAQAVAWLCAGFTKYLTSLSTLEWCGEFVSDIGVRESRLRLLTEAVVPGWYAGSCRKCEAPTYVVPGLTWVTCKVCGSTTYARDHLETVLAEAGGWLARPKPLAEAVVALLDTELSVPRLYSRIRQWAHQGQLEAVRHTARGYSWNMAEDRFTVADEEVGHARYRLGDVVELALRNTRTVDHEQAS